MAMNVGGKKGGAMSDINVTPMADIMIVLLIIFMVITPMLQKGVDVVLPKAANSKEKQDNPKSVVVAVRKDNTLYLNSIKLANGEDELRPQLRDKIDALPDTDKVVYLKADIELPYSEVMKVMDLCREAGAEEVALIVEKKVQS
jgi:biopolymer transport protein TolR